MGKSWNDHYMAKLRYNTIKWINFKAKSKTQFHVSKFGIFLPKFPTFIGQYPDINIIKDTAISKNKPEGAFFNVCNYWGKRSVLFYICAPEYKSPFFFFCSSTHISSLSSDLFVLLFLFVGLLKVITKCLYLWIYFHNQDSGEGL